MHFLKSLIDVRDEFSGINFNNLFWCIYLNDIVKCLSKLRESIINI